MSERPKDCSPIFIHGVDCGCHTHENPETFVLGCPACAERDAEVFANMLELAGHERPLTGRRKGKHSDDGRTEVQNMR